MAMLPLPMSFSLFLFCSLATLASAASFIWLGKYHDSKKYIVIGIIAAAVSQIVLAIAVFTNYLVALFIFLAALVVGFYSLLCYYQYAIRPSMLVRVLYGFFALLFIWTILLPAQSNFCAPQIFFVSVSYPSPTPVVVPVDKDGTPLFHIAEEERWNWNSDCILYPDCDVFWCELDHCSTKLVAKECLNWYDKAGTLISYVSMNSTFALFSVWVIAVFIVIPPLFWCFTRHSSGTPPVTNTMYGSV